MSEKRAGQDNVPFLSSGPADDASREGSGQATTSQPRASAVPRPTRMSAQQPSSSSLATPLPVYDTSRLSPPTKHDSLPRSSMDSPRSNQHSSKNVSFHSDSVRENLHRVFSKTHHSDSPLTQDRQPTPPGSRSQSPSPGTSPFQRLGDLIHGVRVSRHPEPFVLVDPFSKIHFRWPSLSGLFGSSKKGQPDPEPGERKSAPITDPEAKGQRRRDLFTSIIPAFLYLHFLFRLPAMYFTRVETVFQDAEVSRPDIDRMIAATKQGGNVPGGYSDAPRRVIPPDNHSAPAALGIAGTMATFPGYAALPFPEDWTTTSVSPALVRFKNSWEDFIDTLLREWKTLNIVSALLLSALVGLFQIDDASQDPVVRTPAFLSLICSLMSLSYGCIYIVRFSTMRSMYRASRWAEEAKRESTFTWWNIYVLLAMPAVWMAWSVITFIVCILSYLWRTGGENDPEERAPLSRHGAMGPRIAVTVVFALGLLYFALIIRTLARYGTHPSRPYRGTTPPQRTQPLPTTDTTPPSLMSRGRPRKRPTVVEEHEDEAKEHDAGTDADGNAGRNEMSTDALGLGLPDVASFNEEIEDETPGQRDRDRERERNEERDSGWLRTIPRIKRNDDDSLTSA